MSGSHIGYMQEIGGLRRRVRELEEQVARRGQTIAEMAATINRLPDWETFERMRDAGKKICEIHHGDFWFLNYSECPFCGVSTRTGY